MARENAFTHPDSGPAALTLQLDLGGLDGDAQAWELLTLRPLLSDVEQERSCFPYTLYTEVEEYMAGWGRRREEESGRMTGPRGLQAGGGSRCEIMVLWANRG